MNLKLGQIALVVRDYDEAIAFYTEKLHFQLIEDSPRSATKRWVVIAPPGDQSTCRLLLAKAKNEEQRAAIGNQAGGRVFLFLYTDDFWRDYQNMQKVGVEFTREPREEDFGTATVFKDLYGNLWDFIQLKE